MSLGIARIAGVCAALLLAVALNAQGVRAGEADVLEVKAKCKEDKCRFLVTVRHADEGWKHYANRWEVLDLEGTAIGFEVFLERLPKPKAKAARGRAPLKASPYPSVDRDFAFVRL